MTRRRAPARPSCCCLALPLISAYTSPLAPFPLSALAAACPRLSALPTHPLKPARTPAWWLGSAHGSAHGPAPHSPLSLYLSVCPLNPLARSPPLSFADPLCVACLTVSLPLSLRLSLGPMPRLRPEYHPLLLALPSLKCVRISATLDLKVPQLVCAARDTVAANRDIVLMAWTAETAACERPLVACRTYFVSAWCGPLGPRIRFPGEM